MTTDEIGGHWQRIYGNRSTDELSWTERVPNASLRLIQEAALPRSAAILDVGGGASRLAAELLGRGYGDVTVADISSEALERAKTDLGEAASKMTWIEADVRIHDFGRRFDLWHDRAVFHFMVAAADRDRYLSVLDQTLRPGGHLILATFGLNGPTECSNLPVQRYSAKQLSDLLADNFQLLDSQLTDHETPSGSTQQFLYAHFLRLVDGSRTEPGSGRQALQGPLRGPR